MFSFFRHIELTCQDILDIKDEDKSTCDEVQVFHELKDTDQFISLYQVGNTPKFVTYCSRSDFGKTRYWFLFQLCIVNSKANRDFFNGMLTFYNTLETLAS